MPNRLIKESALTSRDLDRLSDGAERLFWRLTVIADDAGRFDADPRVLLAKAFPLRVDRLKPKQLEAWRSELVDSGLVKVYTHQNRVCGYFPTWQKHQRVYGLKSKFPDPPADCGNFPQAPAESGSYPISENRESIIDNSISAPAGLKGFDVFWSQYPKKKSKGQAEKTWAKLKPDEQLQKTLLEALQQAKTSPEWTKDGGQFIPHPATWLNAKGWEDDHSSPLASGDWKETFLEGSA